MHTIAFPGATGTIAFGINFSRSIVGQYFDSHDRLHGFLAITQ
jgi:hypothetical protein